MSRMLVIEPYYGGSHRAVLDGLLARLGWEADVLTLPARKWKWRMRGAALWMSSQIRDMWNEGVRWDLVYSSTFVDLAALVGLADPALAGVPRVLYFHENQLVYPNRYEQEWDYQFPLTNIISAVTSDVCVFNSRFNLEGMLRETKPFLSAFPDHVPRGVAERIGAKSLVLPPPFDPAPFDEVPVTRGRSPRVVWPHRWEHDKAPGTFFEACGKLASEGLDFEVAVAGQAFQDRPAPFEDVPDALAERIVHLKQPEDVSEYAVLLSSSDISVSTAANEFFGIAMMESCYAGCMPLVPNRLSYPELYEPRFLYEDREELTARLRSLLAERPEPGAARDVAERYTFDRLVPYYERVFGAAVERRWDDALQVGDAFERNAELAG